MTTPFDSRRDFLRTSALATAATAIGSAGLHAAGSDVLKIGLIGCGGRGTGAVENALLADPNVKLVSLGDAFPDRIESCLKYIKRKHPEKVEVAADHQFTGFDAFQKVIDSGVDVVLLCTPPAFRPQHFAYAVEKGKHVFFEKPMATDVVGVRSVLESVRKAKEKNLSIFSGFCYRYQPAKRETVARIHEGAIGDIQVIHSSYNTQYLWNRPRQKDWSDTEFQMRNWLYYTWLSGDHYVEQHIHNIDKICWLMKDTYPVAATGLGGRQTRVEDKWGNVFDHFAVIFEYANGSRAFTNCRQIENCATDVSDHVYGTKGYAELQSHQIRPIGGEKWHFTGQDLDMYQSEHNELFASIRGQKAINNGESAAMSTLMGLMGRTATYTGQKVTWDFMLNKSKESLVPEKLEFGPLPFPPVAKPGQTKLV